MGKREQQEARADIKSDKARSQAQTDKLISGWDPERKDFLSKFSSLFPDVTNRYRSMADTGGFDPRVSGRLGDQWNTMSLTGGYTPEQIAAIRGRSNAEIPAVFGRTMEGIRRQRALQGGYSPGATAALAKSGRDMAQTAATTVRDTEVDLADRQRQGKLIGMQGSQGLQESLRQGRLAGIGGLGQQQQTALGQANLLDANKLSAMGMNNDQIKAMMDLQTKLAFTPGIFDNIMRGVGAATGMASAFVPGMGAMKALPTTMKSATQAAPSFFQPQTTQQQYLF